MNIRTDSLKTEYNKALITLDEMESLIRTGKPKEVQKGRLLEPLKPKLTEAEFAEMITEEGAVRATLRKEL